MKKVLIAILVTGGLTLGLNAVEIQYAPEVTFQSAKGVVGLKSLRGKPVVLLIAKSPRSGAFRKQVKNLEAQYRLFASREVIFLAAFTESTEGLKSDIPFIIAQNGPAVAAAYGSENGKFRMAIIGMDGNLDMQTSKVASGLRVKEVVDNSYLVQHAQRKEIQGI